MPAADWTILAAMNYAFGAFVLDLAKAELRNRGRPHRLEPQVFALIAFLVEHRERLVSRDEIFEKVWDGRVVSDSALSSRVKSARKALGDDGKSQRFIKTVHGQGFRFVARVQVQRDAGRAMSALGAVSSNQAPAGAQIRTVETNARPSIAILPFRFIGDASPYATIAEGLPHELITELARLRWLFVIARNSSFRLRDSDMDIREIGRILGVRYCLSGMVEVNGRHLTVATELVDARRGDVFWGESFTGSIDDVHAFRSDIRTKILASLEAQIPLNEAADARLTVTENLDAWSAYHLGLQHLYRFNRRDNVIAAGLFKRAVAQDPDFARAHAGLSFVHFQTAFMQQAEDPVGEIALARRYAQRGVEIDPLDPFVNFTMGRSYWLEADLDQAMAWLERAVSLCPNYAQGIYARSWTDTIAGKGLEGRRHVDLAMRLSPLDPLFYAMLGTRGLTHIEQGEDAEGARWLDRAARSPGAHVLIAMLACVGHKLAGNEDLANAWANNVRERRPGLTGDEFFRAFPLRSVEMRPRVSGALERLGFIRGE